MLDSKPDENMLTNLQMEAGQTGRSASPGSSIISLDSIATNARLRVVSQLQGRNIDLEIHNPDGRLMIKQSRIIADCTVRITHKRHSCH